MTYEITGGKLWIEKKMYMKEMMKADGILKQIIALHQKEEKKAWPKLLKATEGITFDYSQVQPIAINDKDIDLFKDLKDQLGQKMNGQLLLTVSFIASHVIELNFD